MKKRTIFGLSLLALVLGGSLSAVSGKKSLKPERVLADEPAQTTYSDHYLGYFMDEARNIDNGAMTDYGQRELSHTDPTSNVKVKFSICKQNAGKTNLYFGRYSDNLSSATAVAIYNSTDPDFQAIYAGISSKYPSTEFNMINAFFTEDYITNVQDIALFGKGMEAGNIVFIYQLEGESNWTYLTRDDGESGSAYASYSSKTMKETGAGDSSKFNYRVAYSASYNNSKEPRLTSNGTSTFCNFNDNLRGRTARIGVLFALNNTSNAKTNYFELNGFMVNRAKSAKAIVNGVKDGSITTSTSGYNVLLGMCQYKILKQQARSLLESIGERTYYDEFNGLYNAAYGSDFFSAKPNKREIVNLVFDKISRAFTYDGQPKTPDANLVFFDDGKDAYYAKINVTMYSSDTTGREYSSAPSDPFYYAMLFELDEPYAFTYEGSKYIVFHIDEASDGSNFLNDWATYRASGSNGMCSMLESEESREQLRILILRHDTNIASESLETVDASEDVTGYTIGQSVYYFRGVLGHTIQTEHYQFEIIRLDATSEKSAMVPLIVVISVVSVSAIGILLVIKRKRLHN